jgi:hypothetical protein
MPDLLLTVERSRAVAGSYIAEGVGLICDVNTAITPSWTGNMRIDNCLRFFKGYKPLPVYKSGIRKKG